MEDWTWRVWAVLDDTVSFTSRLRRQLEDVFNHDLSLFFQVSLCLK